MKPVKLWEKIGKVSLDEAIGLVLKHRTRYGRRVATQSPEAHAKISANNRKVLEDHLDKIESKSKALAGKTGIAVTKKLLQLRHQREILTAMSIYGNRKLHATELTAALALAYGLEESVLRPRLNALRVLERLTHAPFSGIFRNSISAIRSNLLKGVHDELANNPSFFASGVELASRLSVDATTFSNITPILDLAGLVHKLPTDSRSGSFVWTHASNSPPEPTWNLKYQILKKLANNAKPIPRQELLAHLRGFVAVAVKKSGALHSDAVHEALGQLAADGAITLEKTQQNPKISVSRQVVKLVWRTQSRGVLHPDLNKILLGAFSTEAISQRKKERVLKEIALRLGHEREPGLSAKALVKKLGLNMAVETAWDYLNRGVSTLSRFKPSQLKKIAGQFEREGFTDEAEFIRRTHLKAP